MRQTADKRWAIPKSSSSHSVEVGDVISDGSISPAGPNDWRKTGLRIEEITEDEYIGSLVEVE